MELDRRNIATANTSSWNQWAPMVEVIKLKQKSINKVRFSSTQNFKSSTAFCENFHLYNSWRQKHPRTFSRLQNILKFQNGIHCSSKHHTSCVRDSLTSQQNHFPCTGIEEEWDYVLVRDIVLHMSLETMENPRSDALQWQQFLGYLRDYTGERLDLDISSCTRLSYRDISFVG